MRIKGDVNISTFEELNGVDITPYIKKKNNLSYLPWSSAWEIVKLRYPDATFQVNKDSLGNIYHTDGKTCWVETQITIEGEEQSESLAVMDFKNQSIPFDNVKSTEYEKSIRRCLVKNLALFGLGLSLWNGEELSEAAKGKKKAEEAKKDEENRELIKLQAKCIALAKDLTASGTDSKMLSSKIEEVGGNVNPNAITDTKSLEDVLALLTELKNASKKTKEKK